MTSSIELEQTLKSLGSKFGGVFSKDELRNIKPDGKYYIINLGDRNTGGTHWTMVCDDNPKTCIYYDSYGVSPPDEIRCFMSRCDPMKKLVFNTSQHQALNSDLCGEFCAFMALMLSKGFSYLKMVDTILRDQDFKRNEALVKGIIKRN